MPPLVETLSYLVFTGFMFAAVCAMTRGGRGWPWRVLTLEALVGVDVAVETCWQMGEMPFDLWLAICFCAKGGMLAASVFVLSRDPPGRRLFLSIVYCAYAACYASVFHLFAYRDVFGLSGEWRTAIGLSFVAAANLAFMYLVLPCVPSGDRNYRWSDPCLGAGVLLLHLFGTGIWPISVVTASGRSCLLFALASATAWIVFPLLCRAMRMRLLNAEIAHNLDMMVAEVKERRAALDEARRLRHDQRHHRIVIADLLLRDRPKEALAYVNALDREGGSLAGTADVWCRNETVNAILAGAARKAASLGVGFSAEAHVERTTPLPDTELVSLVANLVENAIGASGEKLKLGVEVEERNCSDSDSAGQPVDATSSSRQNKDVASSDRRDGDVASTKERGHRSSTSTLNFDSSPQVTCTLRQRGDMFGLTVTNPVPEGFSLSPAGWPCTAWGVGLSSVGRIVAKYRGEWLYRLENGLLTCSVAVYAEGER